MGRLHARFTLLAGGVLAALLVLAAALPLRTGSGAQADTPVHITQAEWQMVETPGFNPPAVLLHREGQPLPWKTVDLPLAPSIALLHQARGQDAAPAARVSWLRLSPPAAPTGREGPLMLYGARIKTDGTIAVYADGLLVHRAQAQGPLWNSTRTPLWARLSPDIHAPTPREIVLRIEHSARTEIAVSTLWLGSEASLVARHGVRHWLQLELPVMLSAAFLAVGIFALFIWLRRRHEIGYLLFFALSTASFFRSLHFYIDRPVSNDWFAWLTVNSLFWLLLILHFFLRLVHGQPLRWLTRLLCGVTLMLGVLTLPLLAVLPNTVKVTPLVYAGAAVMGLLMTLVGGVHAWRRSREGQIVVIGFIACLLFGFSDWLLQNNVVTPESLYFGAYANAITCAVFGGILYRRYINAIGEVEAHNVRLAERLQERETELEFSHQRLREIERQQTLSGERQRLMQDMHDGLGSTLISAIRQAEHGGMSDAKVAQLLKDCLDDLKLTIDSMEPVEADLLLLLATLRFRLEPRLEGTGIHLDWQVRDLPTLAWLDPSSALHILRIVQESIANILRHTRASEIRLSTTVQDDGVQVCVSDNGQGFDVSKTPGSAGGRGLSNQQRRAQALGGRVHWTSGADGTQFTLWLPLVRTRKS